MTRKVRPLGSFSLSLNTLRWIAIIVPVTFGVGIGVFEDQVLEPMMAEHWAHILVTAVIGLAALAFSTFIFTLLGRTYRQLKEHEKQLERQAVELQSATQATQKRAEEWKSLFELGREVTASPDLEALLHSIVSRAKSLLNTDIAALMLLTPDGEHANMAAQAGLRTPAMQQLRLPAAHGIQGLVLETGGPVIVEDYQSDDRLRSRPARLVAAEGLVSLVSVPFSGKGRPLGTLTVGNRQPTRFDQRHAELLEAFASWAAVAAETSHLYEKVESLARLEERERIGMDLHDGVIQSIYAVGLNLEDCAERVEQAPEDVRKGLERAIDDLSRVIKDIRSYIFDLRPQVSQVTDLPQAVSELVRDVRVNTLMDVELAIEGKLDGLLDQDQALALFHIAQEALNNVSRHSQASSVRVRLAADEDRVVLEVQDNGVGFDVKESAGTGKQGMRNINDRARSLGAALTVASQRGLGTRVAVELPMARVKG
ncbi:MAG: GAF domain-containing sensor histidine kinase [Chloroflexi bacterium]|nr:GAF domain-containing sensor histidine kinase [Chloroflexota bacterium]